jgi:NADPH:quinone reductase
MHLAEMPKPTRSKPGDVLVENYATSVNPVDFKLRAGLVPFAKLPKVPGGDVAGVVVEADPGSQWKPGARVYALTEGALRMQCMPPCQRLR